MPRVDEKLKWKAGWGLEMGFWETYFSTKGGQWADGYKRRLDPNLPLQPRPAALIPDASTRTLILDVGAGPLTYLGKTLGERHLDIIAVDPLAAQYDSILIKHGIEPIVRTQLLAAERLTDKFPENTFDLVFARNCIDHSYNPEQAILQMIEVVRSGGYVLLEHRVNEGERERYQGLHQWDFFVSEDGDFMLGSQLLDTINVTTKHASICDIACETVEEGSDGVWLVTRIRKKGLGNAVC